MTEKNRRTGLTEARGARPMTAEIEAEYAATRIRYELWATARARRVELGLPRKRPAVVGR